MNARLQGRRQYDEGTEDYESNHVNDTVFDDYPTTLLFLFGGVQGRSNLFRWTEPEE